MSATSSPSTIRQFDFEVSGVHSATGDAVPIPPVVVITLARWTVDEDGTTCLSPELASPAEIDDYTHHLMADLYATGERAKAALFARSGRSMPRPHRAATTPQHVG